MNNSEDISFPMGDFLTNAGLVGFSKLLVLVDSEQKYYQEKADEIIVNKNFFLNLDLTQAYFNTLTREYEKSSGFNDILVNIDEVLFELKKGEVDLKKIKEKLSFIKERLSSNSYKTGYETIKNLIDNNYDLYAEIKKINESDEIKIISERLSKLKEFLNLNLIRETFLIKNIAYSIINNFWDNKSFLHRNNAKKNMKEVHKQEFEIPLKKFLTTKIKRNFQCSECGAPITKTEHEKIKFTFMKDTAEDLSRKKSIFWNFKVNTFICPKCAFILALVPLGFKKIGEDFMFINQNNSIFSLKKANSIDKEKLKNLDEEDISCILFNQLLEKKIEGKLRHEKCNIQVITRSKKFNRYIFNIIGKETLEIIDRCKNELQKLKKIEIIRTENSSINIYQQTLNNILNHLEQYPMINYLFLLSLKRGYENIKYYIYHVFNIQAEINSYKNYSKEKGEQKMTLQTKYWYTAKNGKQLREEIIGDNSDDSAIIGISYKLLNSLKHGDIHQFMDIIIRLYNSVKLQIPPEFILALNNKAQFKDIGYAFMLGFRGAFYDSKENEEKNNLEEAF